jgi:hypothetical protein
VQFNISTRRGLSQKLFYIRLLRFIKYPIKPWIRRFNKAKQGIKNRLARYINANIPPNSPLLICKIFNFGKISKNSSIIIKGKDDINANDQIDHSFFKIKYRFGK